MAAVTLISAALGELLARTIKSPPGALGVPSVGFMSMVTTRLAYAIATSPLTVTLSELAAPLPQPTTINAAAKIAASATAPLHRLVL